MLELDDTDGATPCVAIVGGGCAGTLTAANLLRRGVGRLRVVLIERTGRFGPGVAYATDDDRHRLNVVAERLSAYEDEPGHFAAWARTRLGVSTEGAYLPRGSYGEYLRDVLADAERQAPAGRRLERVTGEVVDVELLTDASACRASQQPAAAADGAASANSGGRTSGARTDGATGAIVVLADGRRIAADHVVLALGGLPPVPPVALPDDPRIVADPWAPGALVPGDRPETTLIVGSGLTAVDVALTVCGASERSRVVAISRNGCLPFDHLPGLREPIAPPEPPPALTTLTALERWLRRHLRAAVAAGHDWRDAFDGLRPLVPSLWQSLTTDEQRRFLSERARSWELRRHRMAPEVAAEVRGLLSDGRLLVRSGRIVGVRAWSRRRPVEVLVVSPDNQMRTLRADRVVMCTGPGVDVRRAPSRLVRTLLRRGVASPDVHSLGLRATADGALLSADGHPQPRLRLLGPLRRGELWETTAVREIRIQARTVADAISGALTPAPTVG